MLLLFLFLLITVILKAESFSIDRKDFQGRPFIWITLENNSPRGRLYYMNKFGDIDYSCFITSGAVGYRTPTGKFKVYYKKKEHMSTKFPDPSGRNNMNYSMFFYRGFAVHQGSIRSSSHGCIHVSPKIIKQLYNDATTGTPVVITRVPLLPRFRTKLMNMNLSIF
jgi:lipoprotein-anchoring transpeptidase ErfK/SrfK